MHSWDDVYHVIMLWSCLHMLYNRAYSRVLGSSTKTAFISIQPQHPMAHWHTYSASAFREKMLPFTVANNHYQLCLLGFLECDSLFCTWHDTRCKGWGGCKIDSRRPALRKKWKISLTSRENAAKMGAERRTKLNHMRRYRAETKGNLSLVHCYSGHISLHCQDTTQRHKCRKVI